MAVTACVCEQGDAQILRGIRENTLSDKTLVNDCCWKTICGVRGRNLDAVDKETWREICRRRGRVKFGT